MHYSKIKLKKQPGKGHYKSACGRFDAKSTALEGLKGKPYWKVTDLTTGKLLEKPSRTREEIQMRIAELLTEEGQ